MLNIFTEVNKNISEEIKSGNYDFFSIRTFFGFDDFIRFIKIIYLLINIILDIIILISIIKTKKLKSSVALQLKGNILIINFIHTLSYTINWVTNISYDKGYKLKDEDNHIYNIGGLLIGNPTNYFWVCKTQAFMIIFSSISQDLVIIIFFYIINRTKIPKIKTLKLITISLGYFLPFIIAFIYLCFDGLGLNDRYCYIKKFDFSENSGYNINPNFDSLITIIYTIRAINLSISICLIIKIIMYIKTYKLTNLYIIKTSSILIIQTTTITIGLIYRISHFLAKDNNIFFSNLFLFINTMDGILYPLYFCLSNGIFGYFFCNKLLKHDNLISVGDDDDLINHNNNSDLNLSSKSDKNFVMFDVKDDNNFDISYFSPSSK